LAAEKLLNTAELNALSLAMFLLCARKLHNPSELMLFDDPLQNMDELTVTTVARGIRRLLLLWQQNDSPKPDSLKADRLAIFLHGKENLERFRRETSCAVYSMSWLPVREGADDPTNELAIESVNHLVQDRLLQPVSELLLDVRSCQ
jgi:hypothetical protein